MALNTELVTTKETIQERMELAQIQLTEVWTMKELTDDKGSDMGDVTREQVNRRFRQMFEPLGEVFHSEYHDVPVIERHPDKDDPPVSDG